MYTAEGFEIALAECIPEYSPFGETVVRPEEWKRIGCMIPESDTLSREVFDEANQWAEEVQVCTSPVGRVHFLFEVIKWRCMQWEICICHFP
ncbi:MAG: hypothetical protein Q4B85_10580 [Lachnospiraceae bacterium]|nr:hypothetical protein [Lachnospiraceae bacterium]